MGGAVSAGEDNDELIDNLIDSEYIKSYWVEKAFRAVDRGDYYLEGCRENAYRDLAWKHGLIHMSAPCIYSEVMESLKLGPGMSFLNLGSGTGYLSTMAGLIIGPYGINHGIELHQSNVDYAIEKLEEFQNFSPAMDKYEFCPPNFVVGNCLLLDSSSISQYDRVYCGAQCPSEHENFVKNLIRVGGILVMPLNDNLLQVIRTSETTFEVKNVLPVSFASLVVPNPDEEPLLSVKLPECHPQTLQELCRSTIRMILRKVVEAENSSLTVKRVVKPKRRKGKPEVRRIVIPCYESLGNLQAEFPVSTRNRSDQRASNEIEIDLVTEDVTEDTVAEASGEQAAPSNNQEIIHDQSAPSTSPKRCSCKMSTESNNNSDTELDVEIEQEKRLESVEEVSCDNILKSGRRRTLTANGDSGIDNISDDSFPEEEPSDNEKIDDTKSPRCQSPDEDNLPEEPVNSGYRKRSAEENEEVDHPDDSRSCSQKYYPHCRDSTVVFKRVAFSDPDSDELEEIDSDAESDDLVPRYDEKIHLSRYTYFMKQKIVQLPIPHTLKIFLNLSRPL